MAPRDPWYHSRMNQAAFITGVCAIIAAVLIAFGPRPGPESSFFEIQGMDESGQLALARIALDPIRPILDSTSFGSLESTLFVDDSTGVAFSRPVGQEWTVGAVGRLMSVTLADIPLLGLVAEAEQQGWPSDTLAAQLQYVGVRRDHPVSIMLTTRTRVGDVELGHNPFNDPEYAIGWLRMLYGQLFSEIPIDSLVVYARNAMAQMDSIIGARLPITRDLFTGVYVARITTDVMPGQGILRWMNLDLLENVARHSRSGPNLPSMLLVNRERGFAIVNESFAILNAVVNGVAGTGVIVNRLGYAVRSGDDVYLVLLQYISADPPELVAELERVFRSVRLKGAS